MRRLFISGSIFLGLSVAAVAGVVRGSLLNDDDPYFIKGDDGNIYKAEWYGGSTLFFEGDEVILTNSYGSEKMIDGMSDETADIWVEEISEQYPLPRLRPQPPPNLTPPPPGPYYSTPAPPARSMPTPPPHYKNEKWPDGRMLIHPEHFVKAYVINVAPADKLQLRSGPGTRFDLVIKIPPNGTNIIVFDQDQVWDVDTWWCPVEWHGFRGYVGRHYLTSSH
jgi:hypothetical protein